MPDELYSVQEREEINRAYHIQEALRIPVPVPVVGCASCIGMDELSAEESAVLERTMRIQCSDYTECLKDWQKRQDSKTRNGQ